MNSNFDIHAQLRALQALKAKDQAEQEKQLKEASHKDEITALMEEELRKACYFGQRATVILLLSENTDIQKTKGYSPSAPFATRDSQEWKINPYQGDAIHNAICGDQPATLDLLLDHVVNLQKQELVLNCFS
jgi:hypothetical protein